MRRLSRIGLPGLLALTLWALAPTTAGACENERIRSLQDSGRLPDCRAYEQATPLGKNGNDVTSTVPLAKAALGGGSATLLSNVADGVFRQYTPLVASRGESTWSAKRLLPPPRAGWKPDLIGLTPDLSQAFMSVGEGGEPPLTALFSRSTGDGAMHTIVPPVQGLDPRFVGASQDGSLVVFESPAALPGSAAIAGVSNLYAWSRPREEVELVGVLNDGNPPAEGAFGGSYDWVRGSGEAALGAGGARRSYYTQDQNVVAADGAAIYFTAAGTGQLYLRRNPVAAQSPLDGEGGCTDIALACTVRVSASGKTNGTGPGGTDPLGPGAAVFMAASADGERAFFTSTEELTDDANTGPDKSPPGISRAGLDGSPGSIEPNFLDTAGAGVAVDGTHLYWADPSGGSIGRAAIDGTGVEEDFISGLARPRWVAVDSEYVYWTSPAPAGQGGEGKIGRARLDGSEPPEPGFVATAGQPHGIAVNGTHIFWANAKSHAISRAEIDGSGVEPSFRFIGGNEVPQGVALDGSHVYWTTNSPNSYIARCNLDGSSETFRFIGPGEELRGIAVRDEHVYWSMTNSGRIGRASTDFSTAEPQFIPAPDRAVGLASDDEHLYWASSRTPVKPDGGNDLYRYDVGAGALTDLTADSHTSDGADVKGVLGISRDGAYAYFAANGVLTSAPNSRGEVAQQGTCEGVPGAMSGGCNLYVFNAGTIDFIARLDASGGGAESDAANWATTPAVFLDDSNFQQVSRVSADGRALLFRSRRQLTDYDSKGIPQLYLHREGAGLTCVSCNPSGAPPGGAPTLGTIQSPARFETLIAPTLGRNLSADGRRVFFESVDPLVDADDNGEEGCPVVGLLGQAFPACRDVYQWEAAGSGSCPDSGEGGGCLSLLSSSQAGQPAFFADASGDGSDAFLFTRERLVRSDRDELVDLYDARVEGGLFGQNDAPVGCVGEECRPAPFSSPATEALATEAVGPVAQRRHRARRCAKARRASGKRHCGKRRPGRL